MTLRSARNCALLLLSMWPSLAAAWGEPGHRVVAAQAERQLRPAARAEVARLLAGEPEPSLPGIAAWADGLRESGGPEARRTTRWHFINFKGGRCEYAPARDCPDGNCVVAAINRNFATLADRSRSDDERRVALKFLVHLVGDVHQPLHATPLDDHGGGDFQLLLRGKGSNLHKVWDAAILRHAGATPAAHLARQSLQPPLPPDPTRRSDRRAADWAVESCELVRSGTLYPDARRVDEPYLALHLPLVDRRLRQAGGRLADLLNLALASRAKSR